MPSITRLRFKQLIKCMYRFDIDTFRAYVDKNGVDDLIEFCFTNGWCMEYATALSLYVYPSDYIYAITCFDQNAFIVCHFVCYNNGYLYDIYGRHKTRDLIEKYDILHSRKHSIYRHSVNIHSNILKYAEYALTARLNNKCVQTTL